MVFTPLLARSSSCRTKRGGHLPRSAVGRGALLTSVTSGGSVQVDGKLCQFALGSCPARDADDDEMFLVGVRESTRKRDVLEPENLSVNRRQGPLERLSDETPRVVLG